MTLFSIHCTTCRRRLKVTDPAAIGAILSCPGCGSMVQIAPPEGWQADGAGAVNSGMAAAATAPQPLRPPPLVRAKVPTPELTSEAVEAAVAGVASPPSPPMPIGTSAANTAGSFFSRISPRAMWLSAGGAGIVLVSALVVFLIASALHKTDTAPSVAETTPEATPADKTAPQVPTTDKGPRDKRRPAPEKQSSENLTTKKTTPENPAVETPPAEKANTEKTNTEKTAPENPATEKPPASPPPEPRIASLEKPVPALPAENPPPKAISIIDTKPDVDENLDPVERSASFAFRRGREPIDWPSRLNQPLAGLDCKALPLADFAEMMSDLGNAPLSLDVDALGELGVSPVAPVTLHLGETTLSSALDAGFSPRGLKAVVEGNHLLITRAGENPAPLRSVPYGVSDLAADAAALGELGDAIRTLIAPDSWKEAGGIGTIRAADKTLIIEQTPAAHYQVLLLCEKLRVARGLPIKSKLDPTLFRLEPRTSRAQAKLAQTVTAVYVRPAPLTKVLNFIEKQSGTRLLLDVRGLEYDGIAPDVAGTLAAHAQPLSAALTSLLDPLQLAYRVVDEQTLQITTPRGFRRELELYRVAPLLAGGIRPDEIMDRIAKEVAPGRWAASGGKGTMFFDSASGCLLVAHSQLVQREVQALLTHWRQATVAAKEPGRTK